MWRIPHSDPDQPNSIQAEQNNHRNKKLAHGNTVNTTPYSDGNNHQINGYVN
jgi:hypothetical protein